MTLSHYTLPQLGKHVFLYIIGIADIGGQVYGVKMCTDRGSTDLNECKQFLPMKK